MSEYLLRMRFRIRVEVVKSQISEFEIDRDALSYWNPVKKEWQADRGIFVVQIGASSRDIRLHAPLTLK